MREKKFQRKSKDGPKEWWCFGAGNVGRGCFVCCVHFTKFHEVSWMSLEQKVVKKIIREREREKLGTGKRERKTFPCRESDG